MLCPATTPLMLTSYVRPPWQTWQQLQQQRVSWSRYTAPTRRTSCTAVTGRWTATAAGSPLRTTGIPTMSRTTETWCDDGHWTSSVCSQIHTTACKRAGVSPPLPIIIRVILLCKRYFHLAEIKIQGDWKGAQAVVQDFKCLICGRTDMHFGGGMLHYYA